MSKLQCRFQHQYSVLKSTFERHWHRFDVFSTDRFPLGSIFVKRIGWCRSSAVYLPGSWRGGCIWAPASPPPMRWTSPGRARRWGTAHSPWGGRRRTTRRCPSYRRSTAQASPWDLKIKHQHKIWVNRLHFGRTYVEIFRLIRPCTFGNSGSEIFPEKLKIKSAFFGNKS